MPTAHRHLCRKSSITFPDRTPIIPSTAVYLTYSGVRVDKRHANSTDVQDGYAGVRRDPRTLMRRASMICRHRLQVTSFSNVCATCMIVRDYSLSL